MLGCAKLHNFQDNELNRRISNVLSSSIKPWIAFVVLPPAPSSFDFITDRDPAQARKRQNSLHRLHF
jgi:hypothetical protein